MSANEDQIIFRIVLGAMLLVGCALIALENYPAGCILVGLACGLGIGKALK